MSRSNSGRWRGHTPRPVAEESLPLRLDQPLRRLLIPADVPAERLLRTVTWAPRDQPPVACQLWGVWATTGQTAMRLIYPFATAHISETIAVTFDSKPFGGACAWWLCPGCDRRCGVLYRPPLHERWRCRVCHQIIYTSSKISDKRANRLLLDENLALGLAALLHEATLGDLELLRKVGLLLEQRARRTVRRHHGRRVAARVRVVQKHALRMPRSARWRR
jgi:hypothetical protein